MKKVFILFAAILVLSSIMSAQALNNVTVAVATKQLGYDNNTGRPIVNVGIYVDKMGHLEYLERYYSINESGMYIYKETIKYHDSNITDTNLSFRILRHVDPSGKPYYIKARILLDNVTILDEWLKVNKPNNSTGNGDPAEATKTPGFGAGISVIALLAILAGIKYRKK